MELSKLNGVYTKYITKGKNTMIISFSTHKGGTAKTTSSINLACGLARQGYKTLLVDMDPQGHSSIGLGLELKFEDKNIADVLPDKSSLNIKEIIRHTKTNNLDIAPSNIRLSPVGEALYTAIRKEERLQKRLAEVANDYQYIIIDCPPSLGVLTINALQATEFIIIPCQMSARSTDGLADLLDIISIIKNNAFDNFRILLTHFDTRKSVTNEVILAQLKNYKDKILNTKIPVNEALNQAQIAKESIFDFDPKSTGAQSYKELTEEILNL